MPDIRTLISLLAALLPFSGFGEEIPFKNVSQFDLENATARVTIYRGRKGLALSGDDTYQNNALAILRGRRFHNGTIELDVSGEPGKKAPESARGFVGIAFRCAPNGSRYEAFYIRPTNGRANEQLRRNHSTQYISTPDWPWERLRQETPGVYESYADMIPGAWTHLKVVADGSEAFLYVGAAAQPAMVVHDLKLGDVEGAIALWSGPGTEAYFAGMRVTGR